MRITNKTIIALIVIVASAQLGDYLPINVKGVAIGGIIVGITFFIFQSVLDINRERFLPMLKLLRKNLVPTIIFTIIELFLGYTLVFPIPTNIVEQWIIRYSIFSVWMLSAFYRIVIEATPELLKIDLNDAEKFYTAFSRTRVFYYFLLVFFTLRLYVLEGLSAEQVFASMGILSIFTLPILFLTFYVPYAPSQINWFFSSLFDKKKLKLNLKILQYIYQNRTATLEELKNYTNQEDLILKRTLYKLLRQHFLKFDNESKRFSFHEWFQLKQNIKFYS